MTQKSHSKLLIFLMAFVVYSVLCKYFQAINRDNDGGVFLQIMLQIETLIAIPLLLLCRKKYDYCINSQGNNWIALICIYLCFNILNALAFSPTTKYIFIDVVYWLVFVSFFYLGASKNFWRYFTKTILIIFLISSVLSILELISGSFNYLRSEVGINSDSYLYDIQIGFTPCCFALIYYISSNSKRDKYIAILAFAFYFFLQFYFQKRLPIARIIFTIILLMVIVKKSKYAVKIPSNTVLVTLLVLAAALFYLPKELFRGTIDRFFMEGTAAQTIQRDARYMILDKVVDHTISSPRTFMFGEGTGGCALGNYEGKQIIVNNVSVDGMSEFEVGWASYFFRYGFVFLLIFYLYIFKVLSHFKRYLYDPLAMACWAQIAIVTLFSFLGESFPNVSVPIPTILLASSLGYLSSKNINFVVSK